MTSEDEAGIGHVLQIADEVRRQFLQDICLAVEQSAFGMLNGGPRGCKVNRMEGQPASRWRLGSGPTNSGWARSNDPAGADPTFNQGRA